MSLELIVAFITGVGSVVGGSFALRRARKEEREDCRRRIEEMDKAYHQGLKEGLDMTRRGHA